MRVGNRRIFLTSLLAKIGFLGSLLLVSGCENEPYAPVAAMQISSTAEKQSSPAAALPNHLPPESIKTYHGLTMEEWKQRLKMIGPGVPGIEEFVPGLEELATDREAPPLLRRQATLMLGRLGKASLATLPAIEAMLLEESTESAHPSAWAAKAIALWGPLAQESTPQVIAVLDEEETPFETRLTCLEALAQIGSRHIRVIPTLIRQLKSPSENSPRQEQLDLKMATIDALAKIGAEASIAVPKLLSMIDHENDLLRHKVVIALGNMGPSAAPSATALAEHLVFDDAEEVRRESALSLARLGPEGESLLINLCSDEEAFVRELSLNALGTIPSKRPIVNRTLLASLDDDHQRVRLEAAKALLPTNAAEHRQRLLNTLAELLLKADRRIRREAADVIVEMKPSPEDWDKLEKQLEPASDEYTQRLWKSLKAFRDRQLSP
ncbi:MAG: HEAT repeat domain-containing protein [Planctomycetaceae bacterium]|nr:HEAT repeat domain-containing protein [Planctomycetaceae bacterium]